jgi:La-related protein 7
MAQEMSSSDKQQCATTTTNISHHQEEDGAAETAAAAAAAMRPVVAVVSAPSTPFRFNVHAPEFVPMSSSPAAASPLASPMSAPAAGGYYSPFMQVQQPAGLGPPAAADWGFFHEHEPVFFVPDLAAHAKFGAAAAAAAGSNSGAQANNKGTTGATADVTQKIVKQVYVNPGVFIYLFIMCTYVRRNYITPCMHACTNKQVEYQFSDINLVANEFLLKIMNKDTEGYGTTKSLYLY